MTQKIVLRNEVIKVKGRVKAITIPKEDFDKFLKLTKLRILDKEYEVLMPPIENMMKNTIDVNGLAQTVQNYLSWMIYNNGPLSATFAEMIFTTSSGSSITLSYTPNTPQNVSLNSQGLVVFMQVFEQNGQYTFQYYYVGFDTTNDSYTTTQAELYVSTVFQTNYNGNPNSIFTTPLVRIAYSNISITKSSSEYLFLVWLIEFESIPPYLVFFTPIFKNPLNIMATTPANGSGTNATVLFNNGSCNFACGGSCPSSVLNGFITYIQNNAVVVEFPIQAPLGTGQTSLEVLLCTYTAFVNMPNISGYISTTVTPQVSGATFYVAIATITITYQGS